MKLSRMNTDELARTLCLITPPLCRMARDPEVLNAFDQLSFQGMDRLPTLAAAALVWEKLIPLMLEKHKEDFYCVLSALTDKDEKTLRSQRGLSTLQDLQEIWDGELTAFFTSAGSAEREKS